VIPSVCELNLLSSTTVAYPPRKMNFAPIALF
jgi:hypothetical protein